MIQKPESLQLLWSNTIKLIQPQNMKLAWHLIRQSAFYNRICVTRTVSPVTWGALTIEFALFQNIGISASVLLVNEFIPWINFCYWNMTDVLALFSVGAPVPTSSSSCPNSSFYINTNESFSWNSRYIIIS